jgi:GDP-L-fucose synthase
MLNKKSHIFITGHKGLVGSSILKLFKRKKFKKIYLASKNKLDLRDKKKTHLFIKKNKIDIMIMAAGVVGGIKANYKYQTEFLLDNMEIQNNLLSAALKYKIKKVVFLGSSCISPKISKTPIKEDSLLSSSLEKTNEKYAIAKISGIKLCEAMFLQYGVKSICLMPTNVFGIDDNYDLENGHVIGSLFSKFMLAKKNKSKNIRLIGTGRAIRNFITSDDLANAVYLVLKINYKKILKISKNEYPILNVGTLESISIKNLASLIKKVTNYNGEIKFNNNKFYDGTINKTLSSSKINKLGWKPLATFEQSLKNVYQSLIGKNEYR